MRDDAMGIVEIFTGSSWDDAGPAVRRHTWETANALPDGRVLVIGGYEDPTFAELYVGGL